MTRSLFSALITLLAMVQAFAQHESSSTESILFAFPVHSNEHISTLPSTSITFDEKTVDFGRIKQGDIVQHVFRFVNTGNEPLQITSAKGSCGCTVTKFPSQLIPPNGSGAIIAEFDSKGKIGMQAKMITIIANTYYPRNEVYLKGEVYSIESDEGVLDIGSKESGISIYPNPTDGILWVNTKKAREQGLEIDIFDSNGRFEKKEVINQIGAKPIRLDVSNFESGAYWISVRVGDAKPVNLPFVVAK